MKKQMLLLIYVMPFAYNVAQEGVIISEIFYDTPFNEQKNGGIPYCNGEYVELYNVSSADVDLSGWMLQGSGDVENYVFPANTLLKSAAVCVVAYRHRDTGFDLATLFPQVADSGDNLLLYQHSITLDNEGETITLRNERGWLVDRLQYDGTAQTARPSRLQATNADGIPGSQCQSVTRRKVTLNVCDYAKADDSDFIAAPATPMETGVTIYKEAGLLYTYDNAGNRIGRMPKNIVLNRSNVKSARTADTENDNEESLLQDQIKDYRIIIYPNPTKGRLAVEITPVDDETEGMITLLNMQGVLLCRHPVRSGLSEIDLEGEPSGVYLMLIEIDGQKSSWKVIKE